MYRSNGLGLHRIVVAITLGVVLLGSAVLAQTPAPCRPGQPCAAAAPDRAPCAPGTPCAAANARARASGAPCIAGMPCGPTGPTAEPAYFRITPLSSDEVGLTLQRDRRLKNPWGIAFGLNTPMWIMNNGSGLVSLLYDTGELFPSAMAPRTVLIPSAGTFQTQSASSPTGIVYNRSEDFTVRANGKFGPSRFIIVTGEGLILGWSPAVDANRAVVAVDRSGLRAVYKGVAIAKSPAGHFVYAANFRDGTIESFNALFRPTELQGTFRDPTMPEGYAPHNIRRFGDRLFVAYARQDNNQRDALPGVGRGFISEFDAGGQFIRRFASQGTLNAPWAMVRAPQSFGRFAGALLVGNSGDGRINAFDIETGDYLGQLTDQLGQPLIVRGLRGMAFRSGTVTPSPRELREEANDLYFTAGLDQGRHGMFGRIEYVSEPSLAEGRPTR